MCGAPTMNSRQVRLRGWVLIATGLFLVAFTGGIIRFIVQLMQGPLPEGSDGQPAMTAFVFALLGGLIAIGLAAAAAGVAQVRTGRRSRRGLTAFLTVFAIVMLVAWIGIGLLGGGVRGPVRVPL